MHPISLCPLSVGARAAAQGPRRPEPRPHLARAQASARPAAARLPPAHGLHGGSAIVMQPAPCVGAMAASHVRPALAAPPPPRHPGRNFLRGSRRQRPREDRCVAVLWRAMIDGGANVRARRVDRPRRVWAAEAAPKAAPAPPMRVTSSTIVDLCVCVDFTRARVHATYLPPPPPPDASALAGGAAAPPFVCFPVLLLDGRRMRPKMLVDVFAALCWLCTDARRGTRRDAAAAERDTCPRASRLRCCPLSWGSAPRSTRATVPSARSAGAPAHRTMRADDRARALARRCRSGQRAPPRVTPKHRLARPCLHLPRRHVLDGPRRERQRRHCRCSRAPHPRRCRFRPERTDAAPCATVPTYPALSRGTRARDAESLPPRASRLLRHGVGCLHLPRRNFLDGPQSRQTPAPAPTSASALLLCSADGRAERAHRRRGAQARRRRRCMRSGVRAWAGGRLQIPRRHPSSDGSGRRARI